MCRENVSGQQQTEDDVLDEGLHVGEVDRFAEASAVHLRVEDDKQQRQQCEESLEGEGRKGESLSPYSCDESCSDDCFGKCKCNCEELGCRLHEAEMEEVEIAVHDETGSYRIKELDDAGKEEYESGDESAESLRALEYVFHMPIC